MLAEHETDIGSTTTSVRPNGEAGTAGIFFIFRYDYCSSLPNKQMLVWCLSTVCYAGPALYQHWFNINCFLGIECEWTDMRIGPITIGPITIGPITLGILLFQHLPHSKAWLREASRRQALLWGRCKSGFMKHKLLNTWNMSMWFTCPIAISHIHS